MRSVLNFVRWLDWAMVWHAVNVFLGRVVNEVEGDDGTSYK
jgi:hypothetical protein